MRERIQKILSRSGICSRRKAELLIIQNRILVNNIVASIGDKADINNDIIKVDGYIIPKNIDYKVFLLNKPTGIISSCNDEKNRKTVIDMIPGHLQKGMHPIGRLDKNSRGAILLTNNGLLTLHLTHPKYKHTKIYHVCVKGKVSPMTVNDWSRGVYIENKITKKASVEIIKIQDSKTFLRIELSEGMNRQIRKVAEKLGHNVIDLQRVQIAHIKLNETKEGSWREIYKEDWQNLLR